MSAVEKSVGVQTTPKNTTPTGAQDASCFLEPYSASDLTSDGAEGSQVTSAEDSVNTTERVDEPFQGMGPEIRVTSRGMLRGYVRFAAIQFQNKGETAIIIRGLGNVIGKACTISQLIKRRFPGLIEHVHTGSVWVVDRDDPDDTPNRKLISMISIMLAFEETDENRADQAAVNTYQAASSRSAPNNYARSSRRGRGTSGFSYKRGGIGRTQSGDWYPRRQGGGSWRGRSARDR